jgi:Fur family ferric uptake transcriptional regulator
MYDRLYETLKSSGYSATHPRKQIFEELLASGPLTTATLSQKCSETLDRATVYRTIALFERLGIVNRIWQGFKSQLELSEIFTPHHHHAVCQNCGKTIDLVSPDLENTISKISREHGFLALGHVIELTGYCKICQQQR